MKMKLYNAFGIKPTNTYVSAGSDYYVPNIQNYEQMELALEAFQKSYGHTRDNLIYLFDMIQLLSDTPLTDCETTNALHLYLATFNPQLEELKDEDPREAVFYFLNEMLIVDEDKKAIGVRLEAGDTLFINSGIKVALDTVLSDNESRVIEQLRSAGIGVAGLYVNKSGKGNAGYDVRACLVDEDYAGYVHLSMAYTKDNIDEEKSIVYCGDKLTQMMLIPVFHTQYEEVSEDEYDQLMAKSERGDKGFGSSDVKR